MRPIVLLASVLLAAAAVQSALLSKKRCHPDILFVIEHGCTTVPEFDLYYRGFMVETVSQYENSPLTRGAGIEYGSKAVVTFRLNDYTPVNKLLQFLGSYTLDPNVGNKNNLIDAIDKALNDVLKTATNDPYSSPTIVILLIKENPDNYPQALAKAQQLQKVATVFVVAIGKEGVDFDPAKLKALASNPIDDYFHVTKPSGLLRLCERINVPCLPPTTTTSTTTPQPEPTTPPLPSDFCHQCRNRRNPKDHYADPTNCHWFYQCFYFNDTYSYGIRRPCPPNTFWHDEVLGCLREGNVPCVDACRQDGVSTGLCYGVSNSCNQFFVCSNTGSHPFCCPAGTSFNQTNCACQTSETCNDVCILPTQPPTTVKPPTQISATECIDPYGTTLRSVPGRADLYELVDVANEIFQVLSCAPGTLFDVSICRCDVVVEVTGSNANKCNLWMPFNGDYNDHSFFKFSTFLYGSGSQASINRNGDTSAFQFNGGRIEIPGLKTYDFQKAASFCLFFNGENNGGLLSNNNDTTAAEFTLILARQNPNVLGRLRFWHPNGQTSVNRAITAQGWNQVCVTYDGGASRLYLNGQEVDSQASSGSLAIGHCPYTLANDQTYGDFIGQLDNVLICPFAFTQTDVNAHYSNNVAYFVSQGYIPL